MPSYYINDLYVFYRYLDAAGGIRIGPYAHSADLYLFFLNYTFSARYVEAWKSSDGGRTWAAVDNANRPRMTTWYNTCQDGTLIRVLHVDWATDNLAISSFDMEADAWTGTDAGGPAATLVYYCMGGALHLRSDGSLVCAYSYYWDYQQVRVLTWAGGAWGSPVIVIFEASTHLGLLDAVLGPNDRLHVFAYERPAMTVRHRSVASDLSLGIQQTIAATMSSFSFNLRAVARASGEILLPWVKATVKDIYVSRAASAIDPSWTDEMVTETYPHLDVEHALCAVESSSVLRLTWGKDIGGSAVDDIWANIESGSAWTPDEKIAEGEQPYPWTVNSIPVIVHYWPDAEIPGWYYTPLAAALTRYRVLP